MRSKWAYKVERVKPGAFASTSTRMEQISDALTRRGLDGWELVNVIPMPSVGETHLYFKKPI